MVVYNYIKRILPHALWLLLVLGHQACSSDGQQQQQEGVETDGETDAADPAEGGENEDGEINNFAGQDTAEEGGDGEGSDFANLSNVNDLANGIADAGAENRGNEAQALQNPLNTDNTALAAPAAAEIPMATGDSNSRVVRFISVDGTPIYDKPQADGAPVATMFQGDPLVVMIQGQWAQITEGRYVMTSALSEKAVPRIKSPGSWAGGGEQPAP